MSSYGVKVHWVEKGLTTLAEESLLTPGLTKAFSPGMERNDSKTENGPNTSISQRRLEACI